MRHTVFSPHTTEEILSFVLRRNNRTDLEVELAQRLEIALQCIVGLEIELEEALAEPEPEESEEDE